MKRSFSGLAATAAGVLLVGAGIFAMWSGWDMILLERGWSLFIAGSVFLSGGVVTAALGRVIDRLSRLGEGSLIAAPAPVAVEKPAPAPEQTPAPLRPQPARPVIPENAPAPDYSAERPDFSSIIGALPVEEPTEVDRYMAGDATYVMMSDGSVEVRSAAGRQRYPSLAALRAEAESRQG